MFINSNVFFKGSDTGKNSKIKFSAVGSNLLVPSQAQKNLYFTKSNNNTWKTTFYSQLRHAFSITVNYCLYNSTLFNVSAIFIMGNICIISDAFAHSCSWYCLQLWDSLLGNVWVSYFIYENKNMKPRWSILIMLQKFQLVLFSVGLPLIPVLS